MSSDSVDASELGQLVERTLFDVLHYWVGLKAESIESRGQHGRLLELKIELPSFFSAVSPIRSHWLVLSAQNSPEQKSGIDHQPAFAVEFTVLEWEVIHKRVHEQLEIPLFLLLAIPNHPVSDIAGQRPTERFLFYAIDIRQTLAPSREGVPGRKELLLPVVNELNLANLTLLWASLWVVEFFRPVNALTLADSANTRFAKHTQELVQLAFPKIEHGRFDGWSSLFLQTLRTLQPNLRAIGADELMVRLKMGAGIQSIVHKMHVQEVDRIMVYCPEALHGTVALWLFARFYHQFMKTSGNAISPAFKNQNIRYFPVDIDTIDAVPRILRCALLLVQAYYEKNNVTARIIASPSDSPQNDRSFYGGGIGHFPWYNFASDGKGIQEYHKDRGEIRQSLDFLRSLDKRIVLDNALNSLSASQELSLNPSDLSRLSFRMPLNLFAPQDALIEHPKFLWQ